MRLANFLFVLLAIKLSSSEAQLSLGTDFSGTLIEDGDLFSITNKGDFPISIDRLAVHLDAITVEVMVWYRPGLGKCLFTSIISTLCLITL